MVHIFLPNFVLLSIGILQTWGQLTIQPFGPKMCGVLCQRTKNCSDHIFDEVQLKCQLILIETSFEHAQERKSLQKNPHAGTYSGKFTPSRQSDERMTSQKNGGNICTYEENKDFVDKCEKPDLIEVKRLVENELEVINCKGSSEETCVMQAAIYNYTEMFDFLVQNGCDLSAVDEDNSTVLHHACIGGSMYIVKKLVDDYKSDINWRDNRAYTPLFYAKLVPVFEFLKARGADFKEIDDKNNTILHVATKIRHTDVVKYILSLNIIDVNCKGEDGKTALMIAVGENEWIKIKILHTHGASLTSTDDFGYNVLHIACLSGHLEMVKHLVTQKELKGFKIKKDKLGDTPVQLATKGGYSKIVAFLKSLKY